MAKKTKEERAAYLREWRKKNPDKLRAHNKAYWDKKAQETGADSPLEARSQYNKALYRKDIDKNRSRKEAEIKAHWEKVAQEAGTTPKEARAEYERKRYKDTPPREVASGTREILAKESRRNKRANGRRSRKRLQAGLDT